MSEPPASGCQSTGPVICWATRSSRIRSAAVARSCGLRPRTRALREIIGRLKNVTTAVSPEGSALTVSMAGTLDGGGGVAVSAAAGRQPAAAEHNTSATLRAQTGH